MCSSALVYQPDRQKRADNASDISNAMELIFAAALQKSAHLSR
jgi:hypothetical protein